MCGGRTGGESGNREARSVLDDHGDLLRRALRIQYEETQAFFRAAGVEQVSLFRGIRGIPDDVLAGATEWTEQALSSYSLDAASALEFARGDGGRLLVRTVHRSEILSTYRQGFGTWYEDEFVVLDGQADVYAEWMDWRTAQELLEEGPGFVESWILRRANEGGGG